MLNLGPFPHLKVAEQCLSEEEETCDDCPPGTPHLYPEELNRPLFCVRCGLENAIITIAHLSALLSFTD